MPSVKALRTTLTVGVFVCALLALPASAGPGYGKLTGIVVDPAGVPQMGASIVVAPTDGRLGAPLQLLSNQRGIFVNERLLPGFYSVKVTLAGFLPALERNVRIDADLATLLRIELGSMFSSIEQLRRRPNQEVGEDDWTWVLRTASGARPVLRWAGGEVVLDGQATRAEATERERPHSRVEVTAGARRPGSASNLADAPSSAFAYDQSLGRHGNLLLAGQMNYERSAAAGFATTWLPAGGLGRGARMSLVMRQSLAGTGAIPFRGLRFDHDAQMQVGERVSVRYGAEYLVVGMGGSTTSLRPRAEITFVGSPDWRASLIFASRPWPGVGRSANPLQATLEELDAFPALLVRNGRPLLEGGWHEEIAVERRLGAKASLVVSGFHDRSRHTALFGRGAGLGADFLHDFFSEAFTYDGGASNSWGTRVVYRQKFFDDLEAAVIYAWAGVLVPEDLAAAIELRELLQTQQRHSLAARVSSRIPAWGTHVTASYKWMDGNAVARQDAFGELAYQVDPQLNVSVRQPLPSFWVPGRLEALVDVRNLFARGYVQVDTPDGPLYLIPAQRSLRGGFSIQF